MSAYVSTRYFLYIYRSICVVYIRERRQVKPQRGKESAVRVEIRARHWQITRSLEEQLERRLRFALARFGGRIRRISATLEDINEPRGGKDKHCRIVVSLVPSGSITAEATDVKMTPAVSRAAERAARCVQNALEYERTMRILNHAPPSEKRHPDEGCSP